MRIEEGTCWLRWTAVTPGILGSDLGSAEVDRPTQKEPFHQLPYLPDSALKGVLGALVELQSGEVKRQTVFGSKDRFDPREARSWGRPGPLCFGNAELLAFPLPLGRGGRIWVFPAANIARFLALEHRASADSSALALFGGLEEKSDDGHALLLGDADSRKLPPDVRLLVDPVSRSQAPAVRRCLRRLAGGAVPEGDAWLATAASAAGRLWRYGAEIREVTALDSSRKSVEEGTLRSFELIPPGSVFLSWSTLETGGGAKEAELPDVAQLGAWEGLGLGCFVLDAPAEVEAGAASDPEAAEPGALQTARQGPPAQEGVAEVMVAIHRAVKELAETGEPPLRRTARSAVNRFGPFVKLYGLARALGFSLAKARHRDREPGLEARAHRWLLASLLALGGQPARRESPYPQLGPLVSEGLPLLDDLDEELILERARWLRRFAEVHLRTPAGPEPETEVAP